MIKMSVLEKYENLIGRKSVKKLRMKALKYQHMRILHVNSTKFGGGVAEILQNMIPMMHELELDAIWKTFSAPENFFEITKKMHNALQGNMEVSFSHDEISLYKNQAKSTFNQINPSGDYVIIHDPQPCPVIDEVDEKEGKWLWRCHIDTSNPNPQAWKMIADYLPKYDALIFTKKEYAQQDIRKSIFRIPPSIDPFSEKNREISEERAKEIVEKFVKRDKPLISQISRFDPWKDPFGVIDAYRIVKKNMDLSLVLIGSLAEDDPEGVEYLKKVQNYANSDPDIHIFTNLDGVHDIEVNAFQKISNVILQKSIKEGFGLTVTEALWKETPVIGGNVGGIKLQIEDGKNGFLVDTVEECAQKIEYLLKNPKIAQKMGKRGKEKVKEQFLLINHVNNYLNLFEKLL
ncbi:MAG: glycosyltransferase [Candidatus Lokiarchaeota archaeon]|nr:glycosyltransferase [Candidatus Lokiarchaeota archaeon]